MQNQKVNLSEEEVKEWLEGPITKLYFSKLREQAVHRRDVAAIGGCTRDTEYETGQAYRTAMIQAEVYEACANPSIEDILEEDA